MKGKIITSNLLAVLLLVFLVTPNIYSQCPGSLACEDSTPMCDINTLNGFRCSNPIAPNSDFPLASLCQGVGVPHNLSWWAFIGTGGPLTLTFNFEPQNCEIGQGIQAGVFEGTCDGANVWDCNANCNTSTFTLAGTTIPCEEYYFWVDGCNGDVCNFTISVAGNTAPVSIPRPLPGLTVNGQPCQGDTVEVCLPDLTINCAVNYQWHVNGTPQTDETERCFDLAIPINNDSNIVVSLVTTIGNPNNPNGICDQEMVSVTIKPEGITDALGDTLFICNDDNPYLWNGVSISSSCINPPCRVKLKNLCRDTVQPILFLDLDSLGEISGPDFICEGDSQNLILIGDLENIAWDDGTTDSTFTVSTNGEYCVTGYSPDQECEIRLCKIVEISTLICQDTMVTSDNGSGTGTATIVVTTNRGPLKYLWSNGDTTNTTDSLVSGTYMVLVTNQDGCQKIITVEVPISTSNIELSKVDILLNPNPANQHVQWTSSSPIDEVLLFDLHGTEIQKVEKHSRMQLDDGISSGLFFLVFKNQGRVLGTKKLIIK